MPTGGVGGAGGRAQLCGSPVSPSPQTSVFSPITEESRLEGTLLALFVPVVPQLISCRVPAWPWASRETVERCPDFVIWKSQPQP